MTDARTTPPSLSVLEAVEKTIVVFTFQNFDADISRGNDEVALGLLKNKIRFAEHVTALDEPGRSESLETWPGVYYRFGSNSRPSECDSSWFAHFDSDKMMRHHRDVEKDLRYGLLEPEPARFWRSSACFGS